MPPESGTTGRRECGEADRPRRFCDIPASAFAQPTPPQPSPKGEGPSLPDRCSPIFESEPRFSWGGPVVSFFSQGFEAELSACGVDIGPFLAPDCRGDFAGFEDFGEGLHARL